MSMGLAVSDPSKYGMDNDTYWRMRHIFDVQSLAFTCEILPQIWNLYPEGHHNITMLDVGPRTAAGTGLIGYMHNEHAFSRIKIKTTAIDIDGTYVNYAKDHFPLTKYIVGDVYKTDFAEPFDIVLTSHTIEHVPGPKQFLDRLKALSSGYVVVACPFGEKDLIPGHVNRFTEEFFQETAAIDLKVYTSVCWVQSKACIAVYKGTAQKAADAVATQPPVARAVAGGQAARKSG